MARTPSAGAARRQHPVTDTRKIADTFKGSGGNASAAGVKVDYSYDVKSEKAEHIAIRQGAGSDQGFAEDLAARVQKGDLVIRDLGYFCLTISPIWRRSALIS